MQSVWVAMNPFAVGVLNNAAYPTREQAWTAIVHTLCAVSDTVRNDPVLNKGKKVRKMTYQWLKSQKGEVEAKAMMCRRYDDKTASTVDSEEPMTDAEYTDQIEKHVYPYPCALKPLHLSVQNITVFTFTTPTP